MKRKITLIGLLIITSIIFLVFSPRKNNPQNQPIITTENSNLNLNNETSSPFVLLTDFTPVEQTSEVEKTSESDFPLLKEPIFVIWTGKIHWYMTYGRRLFENLTPGIKYKYFIAEPNDVIEDGGWRYSPTTINIRGDEIVKVTGYIINDCFWDDGVNDSMYRGCVPWVEIEKIEIVK